MNKSECERVTGKKDGSCLDVTTGLLRKKTKQNKKQKQRGYISRKGCNLMLMM
jgi:hypothetical protein